MTTYFEGYMDSDFKPDNQWDLWYFNCHEVGYHSTPSPGWIIQVRTMFDPRTNEPIADQPPAAERERMIVIADMMEEIGLLEEAAEARNFWKAVPRGTPPPTEEEVKAAWHEWKARQ